MKDQSRPSSFKDSSGMLCESIVGYSGSHEDLIEEHPKKRRQNLRPTQRIRYDSDSDEQSRSKTKRPQGSKKPKSRVSRSTKSSPNSTFAFANHLIIKEPDHYLSDVQISQEKYALAKKYGWDLTSNGNLCVRSTYSTQDEIQSRIKEWITPMITTNLVACSNIDFCPVRISEALQLFFDEGNIPKKAFAELILCENQARLSEMLGKTLTTYESLNERNLEYYRKAYIFLVNKCAAEMLFINCTKFPSANEGFPIYFSPDQLWPSGSNSPIQLTAFKIEIKFEKIKQLNLADSPRIANNSGIDHHSDISKSPLKSAREPAKQLLHSLDMEKNERRISSDNHLFRKRVPIAQPTTATKESIAVNNSHSLQYQDSVAALIMRPSSFGGKLSSNTDGKQDNAGNSNSKPETVDRKRISEILDKYNPKYNSTFKRDSLLQSKHMITKPSYQSLVESKIVGSQHSSRENATKTLSKTEDVSPEVCAKSISPQRKTRNSTGIRPIDKEALLQIESFKLNKEKTDDILRMEHQTEIQSATCHTPLIRYGSKKRLEDNNQFGSTELPDNQKAIPSNDLVNSKHLTFNKYHIPSTNIVSAFLKSSEKRQSVQNAIEIEKTAVNNIESVNEMDSYLSKKDQINSVRKSINTMNSVRTICNSYDIHDSHSSGIKRHSQEQNFEELARKRKSRDHEPLSPSAKRIAQGQNVNSYSSTVKRISRDSNFDDIEIVQMLPENKIIHVTAAEMSLKSPAIGKFIQNSAPQNTHATISESVLPVYEPDEASEIKILFEFWGSKGEKDLVALYNETSAVKGNCFEINPNIAKEMETRDSVHNPTLKEAVNSVYLDTRAIAKEMVVTLFNSRSKFPGIYDEFKASFFGLESDPHHYLAMLLYRPFNYKSCSYICKRLYYLINNMLFSNNREGQKLIYKYGFDGIIGRHFTPTGCNFLMNVPETKGFPGPPGAFPNIEEYLYTNKDIVEGPSMLIHMNIPEDLPYSGKDQGIFYKNTTNHIKRVGPYFIQNQIYIETILELVYLNSFKFNMNFLVKATELIGQSADKIIKHNLVFRSQRMSFLKIHSKNETKLLQDAQERWKKLKCVIVKMEKKYQRNIISLLATSIHSEVGDSMPDVKTFIKQLTESMAETH
uniref:SET domain-containing protein n=1 Tax=Rhabditophanes sp. KR3021 TaxID=114890 RepID=A0AC35U5A4_9BILA